MKVVRAKAPLRISFGGGGTDVPPYCDEKGGAVLSATIDKYAYCSILKADDKKVTVHSLDYDMVIKYDPAEHAGYDGSLDLVKATIKSMDIKGGFNLFMHSDAPPGSGLGTSSTITVAMVGAFSHWVRKPMTDYDIANLAYHIERVEVGIKGGKQDQYAAAFGGFNFIEFLGDRTIVNPLRIKQETVNELQYRLLLCYTGKTRLSAGIIDDQMARYTRGKKEVVQAFDETKALAFEMKNALLVGDVDKFGLLLDQAWQCKKKLSSRISDPSIDELYAIAIKQGALGGKLLGAGGGGYILLLCQFDRWHIVAQKLEEAGGKVAKFAFEFNGLQTWGQKAE